MRGRVAYASIHNQGAALQQNARKCLFYCCFLPLLPALTCPQSLGSHSSEFAFFSVGEAREKTRNGLWISQRKLKPNRLPAVLALHAMAELGGVSPASTGFPRLFLG